MPFADGEPETAAGGPRARGAPGVLAEQVRQLLRSDAASPVGDRQLDVSAVERGGHPDRRRRRVAGGVGEQVAEHLHDAGAVGHHARQVRRQVDGHVVAGAAGQERAARRVDERARVGRLGIDRQGAGVDAAGVEQVADEVRHAVGLVVDDAEELHELGRAERTPGAEHGGGGPLDGGERRAQLVAHHAEEVGAHAVELLERGEVLQRDHDGLDPAVAADGGRAEQGGHAGPVGHREHDLLGPHPLGAAEHRRERERAQRKLAAVGAPAGDHVEEVLGGAAGLAQALDDAPSLAVERDQARRRRVEHHHADRGGVDQRLEVGARAALVAEGAGVGDGDRGLRGEQHEQFLVVRREAGGAGLLGQPEAADVFAEVAHRRALEGAVRQQAVAVEAERAEVRGQVREPDGAGEVAQALEQPRAVRPLQQAAVLGLAGAAGDEVLGLSVGVDGGDGPVAGAGQRARAVDDLAEQGRQVEAGADAHARRAQRRDALTQGVDVARVAVGRAGSGGRRRSISDLRHRDVLRKFTMMAGIIA